MATTFLLARVFSFSNDSLRPDTIKPLVYFLKLITSMRERKQYVMVMTIIKQKPYTPDNASLCGLITVLRFT